MIKRISIELREHAPFTAFGALTGILILILFHNISSKVSYDLFYIFHPLHVLLSALTTAAMYLRYKHKNGQKDINIFVLLIIGYVGSIGIATLSDSIMPYLGETLLNMPHRHVHIGFIEKWWLVNPLAFIGIAIAYFKPVTKFPHFGHVLLSTWASLFHFMMAMGGDFNWFICVIVFIFLFLAVWLPCCVSDIVFPLLFVREKNNPELKGHAHHH
jgi:hypothetical protein